MSQNFSDPYQPPDMQSRPGVDAANVEAFRNVAFWQRFFSVLGYIGSGLMVILLIVQVGMAAVSGEGPGAIIGAVFVTVIGLAMTALVYFIPAMLLGGASKASRDLGEGQITLGEYAAHQKKFWRYTGIAVSIILSLYIAMFGILILFGAVFAAARF